MTFEPLEPRRLMTRDLYWPEVSMDEPVDPGQSANVRLAVSNAGTELVTQSFFVELKLVHTPTNFGPINTDFYDPDAIVLKMLQVDFDIPVGPVGIELDINIEFPEDLAPGRHSVVGAIDSTLLVAETNESNNYFALAPTRIFAADKVLVVEGTAGNDSIHLSRTPETASSIVYFVNLNGVTENFSASQVSGFDLRGAAGNDTIVVNGNVFNIRADGGEGNDKIVGGNGHDFLVGGAGRDQIDGGFGNDRLNGNGGNDKLYGNFGADRLYGYAGQDYLDGGSSGDRLDGGAGLDTLFGQSGVDRFFTADGQIDNLFGGSGRDTAERDVDDVISSVEVQV